MSTSVNAETYDQWHSISMLPTKKDNFLNLKHFLTQFFTIDGPRYHFRAKYGKRKRESEKRSKQFNEIEAKMCFFPSPKGRSNWMIYCTSCYSPEWNTTLASTNTSNRTGPVIFTGGVIMAPNLPIGIKRRLRYPGLRKLMNSFKKLTDCVVWLIDQFKTSQTCGKCLLKGDEHPQLSRSCCTK